MRIYGYHWLIFTFLFLWKNENRELFLGFNNLFVTGSDQAEKHQVCSHHLASGLCKWYKESPALWSHSNLTTMRRLTSYEMNTRGNKINFSDQSGSEMEKNKREVEAKLHKNGFCFLNRHSFHFINDECVMIRCFFISCLGLLSVSQTCTMSE